MSFIPILKYLFAATMIANEPIPNVSKKLDIPFHFHALRHNFTTNLINNGVKPNIVKELVRHGDIATTLGIYTHVNNDDLSKTIEEIYGKEDK